MNFDPRVLALIVAWILKNAILFLKIFLDRR